MSFTDRQEKENWESWLNEDYGERLELIRTAVREICDKNKQTHGDLPYYTPHGPEHFQSVEDLIHKLISGDRYAKLSMKERFYLLAAAWLHDLGMLPYVCSLVYRDEFPFAENEIRKRHHITSEKFIVGHWFDLKIDENDKEILGKLSKYHRKTENFDSNDDEFLVGNESFRLTLLSSYLRLADALDIGASRTPAEPYAICLAYDIPEDSKLHWIKSKLVNGIDIDSEQHTITVQFKCPNRKDIEGMIDLHTANEKIDSIINLVTEGLRDELSSVINIITRSEISYFLDIKTKKSFVALDSRMLNDLRELVLNYDIMMAPSASRLLEIILVTIANIMGFGLSKRQEVTEFNRASKPDREALKKKAKAFLDSIESNILKNRPCHLGLRNLIRDCKAIIGKLGPKYANKNAIEDINALYQNHHVSRQKIRENSRLFFQEQIPNDSSKSVYNLLLYGYSELATKAICGLRDMLIACESELKNPRYFYNTELEAAVSRRIRLFICEGQPKTQTSSNDRLIYHDGSQYACYLKQRGFNNISILPDILAGTIMENVAIDFIILGANGVTDSFFTHSAGHLSIVNLAHSNSAGKTDSKACIVLVSSGEKYLGSGKGAPEGNGQDDMVEVEGSLFSVIKGLPPNRSHVWMNRDSHLLDKLYDSKVSFLNPREDRVEIDKINAVISDMGYKSLNAETCEASIRDLFHPRKGCKTTQKVNG